MLQEKPSSKSKFKTCCYRFFTCKSKNAVAKRTITTRPLDRRDILYRGSLANFEDEPIKQRHVKKKSMCTTFVNPELFKSIPYLCTMACMMTFTLGMTTPYLFLVGM